MSYFVVPPKPFTVIACSVSVFISGLEFKEYLSGEQQFPNFPGSYLQVVESVTSS